ncbi:MAG: cation-transporting P-type ATPase, partial [Gammaproteobacteria bacterium]
MNSQAPGKQWHQLEIGQIASALNTDTRNGLTDSAAAAIALRAGPNKISAQDQRSLAGILLRQFADVMILLLAVAAIISGLLGESADAAAIVLILVLNAAIGAIQEYRAQRAVAA